jgi:hypothetical protein
MHTECDIRILIPDGITILLHLSACPTPSGDDEDIPERRTYKRRDHVWVRWGLMSVEFNVTVL